MTTPRRYQLEDVRQVVCWNGRALLAHEMGCGKTFMALLSLRRLPDALPAVVVCPASLKWNWQREASMHVGMRAEVLEGTRPPKHGKLTRGCPLVVLNYDILPAWVEWLRRHIRPRTVILDEAHYLGNRLARRTKAALHLCRKVPFRLALSGTPLTNRPAELWPTLSVVKPKLYPYFFEYAHRFCEPKLKFGRWHYQGATRLPELHRRLAETLMIRRRKEDVLSELPPRQRTVVPLAVPMDRYVAAVRRFRRVLDESEDRGEIKSEVFRIRHLLGKAKLPFVLKWITGFLEEDDGKLVVFGVHRKVVDRIHDRWPEISVKVDGSVVGRKRMKAVDRFQLDPKCRLFVGNLTAAGVGLNLTAAQSVAFAEVGWNPAAMDQAASRLHRIGQKGTVQEWWFAAKGTLDETLCGIIQRKQGISSAILDGGKGADTLDVLDELLIAVRKLQ